MAKNRDHYEAFVDDENFEAYIARKRKNDCFGNHLELQAMSEMFARTIEVYVYKVSLPPPTTNTVHRHARRAGSSINDHPSFQPLCARLHLVVACNLHPATTMTLSRKLHLL